MLRSQNELLPGKDCLGSPTDHPPDIMTLATVPHLQELWMNWDSYSSLRFVLVISIGALIATHLLSDWWKLSHIPTVGGPSLPILSYLGGHRYVHSAKSILQEGYNTYFGKIFKIAISDRWMVIVTGPQLVGELLRMPDEEMSFQEAVFSLMEAEYTLGKELLHDSYQNEIIKGNLTKNLGPLFPSVHDEIIAAFDDYIPKTSEWTPIAALDVVRKIVSRASNRVFVGLPVCRDEDYFQCGIDFATDVVDSQLFLSKVPVLLKPIVGNYVTTVQKSIKRTVKLLDPEINKRKALIEEYGLDYPDKPNDMLSWLLDFSYGDEKRYTNYDLTLRILNLNFAAIHTSTSTFTHALYTLAANPHWIQILRDEVEEVIRKHGWSKVTMGRMHKLDSFMRESTRVNTFNGLSILRLSKKAYTFSDGTTIPAGVIIAAPTTAHHMDEAIYGEAAQTLDPFRFSDKRALNDAAAANSSSGSPSFREQFTATDLTYLPFGHGKHACPGRFFAGNEIKTMLAHLLLNYDVKTEIDGVRPENVYNAASQMPNPIAKVLFRQRQT